MHQQEQWFYILCTDQEKAPYVHELPALGYIGLPPLGQASRMDWTESTNPLQILQDKINVNVNTAVHVKNKFVTMNNAYSIPVCLACKPLPLPGAERQVCGNPVAEHVRCATRPQSATQIEIILIKKSRYIFFSLLCSCITIKLTNATLLCKKQIE
jgi:hypothetical protein